MKKLVLLITTVIVLVQYVKAQAPTLGFYPSTTSVSLSSNVTITPFGAPANTTGITAYTNTNFKGLLQVNPSTGIITITNAYPAGTYSVTIKAFNGSFNTTATFTLIVNNTVTCTQTLFRDAVNVPTGNPLQAVAVGDFNNDGQQDIATANTDNTVSIRLGNGAGSFSGSVSVPVDSIPRSIAISDFNGDGKQDFATANSTKNTVCIRLGNGAGGFSGTTAVSVGANPLSVAVGDFNGDGRADFITANATDNTVSVRLGDGNGNFSGTVDVSVGSSPQFVATGDFNGDGKPDFATANFGGGSVSIRLGDGTGGFTATASLSTSGTNYALAIGDFNMDNKQDIAISNNVSSSVSIYTGNGAGGFSGPINVFVGANPRAIITGDFNGDNIPDFATASAGNNAISIRLSNGAGIYNSAADILVNSPFGMAVGDFDGDGRQDMAIATPGGNVAVRMAGINEIDVQGNNTSIADGDNTPSVSDSTDFGGGGSITRNFTIKNTGQVNLTINNIRMSGADSAMFRVSGILNATIITTGASRTFTIRFTPTGSLGVKTSTVKITSNDCDEALYDFVIQGTAIATNIATYPATTVASGANTTIMPAAVPANTTNITATTSANFKGLLHVNPATGVLRITNAQPAGMYTVTVKAFNGVSASTTSFILTVSSAACSQALYDTAITSMMGGSIVSIAVADFNNDGIQDVATANYYATTVSVRLGNGSGGFAGTTQVYQTTGPYVVVAGDVNGDGNQDLLVGTYNSANVTSYLGDGLGGFQYGSATAVGSMPANMAVSDFNGDGWLDMAVCNDLNDNVSIRLGDGTGRFSGNTELLVGYYPRSIAVADFNSDGKTDLAIVSENGLSVWLGTGTGNFTGPSLVSTSGTAKTVAVADFNNDGLTDIVTTNNNNSASVRLGNGAGGFTGTTNITVGNGPAMVIANDFNGDGKQDFATANASASSVSVRLGDGAGNFTGLPDFAAPSQPNEIAAGDLNGDGRFDLLIGTEYVNRIFSYLNTSNEINVQGNGITITDGDATPDSTDNTNFGTTVVAGISLSRNFIIQNTSRVSVTMDSISVSGTDASLFILSLTTFPLTILPGASRMLTVTFNPASAGLKTAILKIYNNDCDEAIYDFAIQANTILPPPLGSYPPATIVSGSSIILNPSFSPGFYPSLPATASANFKGLLIVNPITGKLTITNAQPAGMYTITVGVPGATTSFVLTVNKPNCSQGEFNTAINTGVGTGPQAIAIADFNNDGKPDVATANFTSNNVSVRLGNGAGGFTGTTTIAVGAGPKSIAVADFNGDGNADFVTANYNTNMVSIRYGNGLGNFNDTLELVVGTNVYAIAASDFNGDGKVDFAVTYYNRLLVSIRLGNGAGGFLAAPEVAVGHGATSIAIGDFNNDGKPDFVTANLFYSSVSVRIGDGLGGFTGTTDLTMYTNPQSIVITDFNGDGKQDIATVNPYIHVRLGDGLGGFGNVITSSNSTVYPGAITAGDFNGDGKQDLVAANANSATASIYIGNGTGSFIASANIPVGSNPQSIAAGDFNGDGRQDFITGNFLSNTISTVLSIEREIDVKGNNANISAGNTSPTAANFTDFGSVATGSNLARTYRMYNTGTTDLIVNNITITGTDSLLFTRSNLALLAVIPAGDSLSFTVSFAPTGNGVKNARVNIFSDDCDESVYSFAIRGTASCSPSSTDNVWLGTTANWNLASNWSLNFIPSECTKVVVNNSVPFMPEISSPTSSCYSLTLNNGATITVKTGGHLNITANN